MASIPLIHDKKFHTPVPKGPYVVGCTDLMVGPDLDTGCFFRLYYPTALHNVYVIDHSSRWPRALPHARYADGVANSAFRWRSPLRFLHWIPFFGSKLLSLLLTYTSANYYFPIVSDADLNKQNNQAAFPVVVFSHGLMSHRAGHTTICSELASNGFIVAATEHRDASACLSYNLIKDSQGNCNVKIWVEFKPMAPEQDSMVLKKSQISFRTQECIRTLDVLVQLNEGQPLSHLLLSTIDLDQFKGSMDLRNPVMAGHSLGGATTLSTLATEKRFRIGIVLDAWMYPLQDEISYLCKKMDQPVIFINMEEFPSKFQKADKWRTMKPLTDVAAELDRPVVLIKGSHHVNQTDFNVMVPPNIAAWMVGFTPTIDPLVCMELNNRLILQFLRKHLGQDEVQEDSDFLEKHKNLIKKGID